MRRSKRERTIAGWREWVSLPELGIAAIKAKIDTGARTSAIHAYRIKTFRRDGKRFARFFVHPVQGRRLPEIQCEAPIVDERTITSSSGQQQLRFVVETTLGIGEQNWPIELTLSNRDELGFRMLLGREATRGRLFVDPGSSYRLSPLTKPKKRAKIKGHTDENRSTGPQSEPVLASTIDRGGGGAGT